MRVKINCRDQVKLNKGNVKTNLFNETKIKMTGIPGTGGGITPPPSLGFDYTLDFGFQ